MKKLVMLVLVAVLSLGVLTACGGGSSAPAQELTVEMGIDGAMAFKPDTLTAKKGEKIKVTLVNKDPSQAHTFLIPTLNVKSGQVAAGQTETIEVTASKTGEHQIICDVPGHKEGGMTGKLIVN